MQNIAILSSAWQCYVDVNDVAPTPTSSVNIKTDKSNEMKVATDSQSGNKHIKTHSVLGPLGPKGVAEDQMEPKDQKELLQPPPPRSD